MSDTATAYGYMALAALVCGLVVRLCRKAEEPPRLSSWWLLTRLPEWETWTLRQRESWCGKSQTVSDARAAAIRLGNRQSARPWGHRRVSA